MRTFTRYLLFLIDWIFMGYAVKHNVNLGQTYLDNIPPAILCGFIMMGIVYLITEGRNIGSNINPRLLLKEDEDIGILPLEDYEMIEIARVEMPYPKRRIKKSVK